MAEAVSCCDGMACISERGTRLDDGITAVWACDPRRKWAQHSRECCADALCDRALDNWGRADLSVWALAHPVLPVLSITAIRRRGSGCARRSVLRDLDMGIDRTRPVPAGRLLQSTTRDLLIRGLHFWVSVIPDLLRRAGPCNLVAHAARQPGILAAVRIRGRGVRERAGVDTALK